MTEIRCDVAIIGAGYAGVNALDAAAEYVPKGGKIVVVDRRMSFGGMWVDQYDYVTLHQPYETFTCGTRKWNMKRHWSHLATKPEILSYFEDAANACTKERDIDLIRTFGYEMTSCQETEDGYVKLEAKSVNEATAHEPKVTIVADKLIKANGFQVPIKQGISFSAASKVFSIAPVDVLTEDSISRIKASEAPIFVIGSGKTSVDAINALVKKVGVKDRVHCISGRGTLFMNRDVMFPQKSWKRYLPTPDTVLDIWSKMALTFNGDNCLETLQRLKSRGFLHSPIDGSTGFVMGISSEEEVGTVRSALEPQESKVFRCHVVDVVSEGGQLKMILRSVSDGTESKREIPEGSIFINCTDHVLPEHCIHEPIMSTRGLICAPQTAMGFTGPSAHSIVHLFFLNKLDGLWQKLPRLDLDLNKKDRLGIELGMIVLVSSQIVRKKLPYRLQRPPKTRAMSLIRAIPMTLRFILAFSKLESHLYTVIPARFTDPVTAPSDSGVLGGNIGLRDNQAELTA